VAAAWGYGQIDVLIINTGGEAGPFQVAVEDSSGVPHLMSW
jgi:hypothetical protein